MQPDEALVMVDQNRGGGGEQPGIAALWESVAIALKSLISQEDIEQKTRLWPLNIEGNTEIDAMEDFATNHWVLEDRIARRAVTSVHLLNKSLEGQGINDIIELARAVGINQNTTNNIGIDDRLSKLGGGNGNGR